MTIVITGASGNVGTALLDALGSDDVDVVAVARRAPDTRAAPYHHARWVTCDLGGDEAPAVLR